MNRFFVLVAMALGAASASAQSWRPTSDAADAVRRLVGSSDLRASSERGTLSRWCSDVRSALSSAASSAGRLGDCLEADDPRRSRFLEERSRVVSALNEASSAVSAWESKLGSSDYKVDDSEIQGVRSKVEGCLRNSLEPCMGDYVGYLAELEGDVSAARSVAESALSKVKDKIGASADLSSRRLDLEDQFKRAQTDLVEASHAFNRAGQAVQTACGNYADANGKQMLADAAWRRANQEYLAAAAGSDPARTRDAKRALEQAQAEFQQARERLQSMEAEIGPREDEFQAKAQDIIRKIEAEKRVRENLSSLRPSLERAIQENHEASDDYYLKDATADKYARWRDGVKKELGR